MYILRVFLYPATLITVSRSRIRIGKLETMAFVSGFALMVFELAGARILAPGIGSSTYVWTSVIGVIIAALSLGYWIGGRIADKRGYMIDVARLALVAAVGIIVVLILYRGYIEWVAATFTDSRLQGVMASIVLFAPTSFVLGMMSPYLAKLNVRSLETTGRAVASLSALNSIGGIVGTFTAGFVLFSYVGARETFMIVTIMMAAVSWLAAPRVQWKLRMLVTVLIVTAIGLLALTPRGVSFDTPSAHYSILEGNLRDTPVRVITTGPSAAQSGISLRDPDQLVFWYTKQMADIVATKQKREAILVLGGGTFTLPRYLAKQYPDSTIDVVEIDPELATIARDYFYYNDPKNINLIFADARTYLNQTNRQYDIILVDVYGDTHVPFTLATKEYGDQIAKMTAPGGIVAANLIAGFNGGCGELLNALDAPYRRIFSHAQFAVEYPNQNRSNIVAAYSNNPASWPGGRQLNQTTKRLYTDNFMPGERLQQDCKEYDT